MAVAFCALGISVITMLLATGHLFQSVRNRIGRWWFLIIGVAFIGAGIFYPTKGIVALIHGICGLIVIITFPIAATLYKPSAVHLKEWAAAPWWRLATILV